MIAVGIRELKNQLSKYLQLVRAGEEVLVTDRGEVIATIRKPCAGDGGTLLPGALAELVRSGDLRPGGPNDPELYRAFPALTPPDTSARLLDDERGER